SGVGSISVAPIMIRNEPDDTNTDSRTITRPMVRMVCLVRPPKNAGRVLAGAGSPAVSGKASLSVVSVMHDPVGAGSSRDFEPAAPTLQDKCCQNVTL